MVGGAASVDTKCRPLTIALEVFIMRWPSRFDDVANGKSLVQGQLVLNFVSPGYLLGALVGQAPAYTPSLGPVWYVNPRGISITRPR